LSVAVAISGCSSDSPSEPAAKASPATGTGAATDIAAPGSTPTLGVQSTQLLSENVSKRTSMEGRWILVFFERMTGLEEPVALIDISKSPKDSKLRAIVKNFGPLLTNPRVRNAVATENSVRLALEMTVQTMGNNQAPSHTTRVLDVLVELRDGIARGSA